MGCSGENLKNAPRFNRVLGDFKRALVLNDSVLRQIEQVFSNSDTGTPCKLLSLNAVLRFVLIVVCGVVGKTFCESCGDYHVTTECIRKPVQNVRPEFRVFLQE